MSTAAPIERIRSEIGSVPDVLVILAVMGGLYVIFTGVAVLVGFDLSGILDTLRLITYFTAVYAMLVLALNLQWGYTGLFNIGVAGFMAVGVYTMAMVTGPINPGPTGVPGLGLPLWVGVIAGTLAAALVGAVAALPALRLDADYLAIVTLALSEIIRLTYNSTAAQEFTLFGTTLGTGGASGINIPTNPQTPIGEFFSTGTGQAVLEAAAAIGITRGVVVQNVAYTLVLVVVVAAYYVFARRIGNSPFGRVLKAIREDELVADSLGKNTQRFKIKVFALGCGLMGLAGILWFGSDGFVNPLAFRPLVTFYVFIALIIGGAGSNTGSVVGAAVFSGIMYYLPQFLGQNSGAVLRMIRDAVGGSIATPNTFLAAVGALGRFDLPAFLAYCFDNIGSLRFIAVGVLLVYLMQHRPDGLFGHRTETAASVPLSTSEHGGESDE